MEFSLKEIAKVLGLSGAGEARITGWSVDSRTVQTGDLFFALRGPNHDGNIYVADALRKGATAAVAEVSAPGAVLVVPDALHALQEIAVWARKRWGRDVVGLTGSAGKTSTKDIIAELLSVTLHAGKTVGNFNNHVGVPLSILRLPLDAEVAVLEIGMNHAGEIRELCQIAQPRIGVVTNVGYAHIEAFESIDGVAAAKRELIECLPQEGIAVLNADDPRVAAFRDFHKGTVITFGIAQPANVRAEDVEFLPDGGARFRIGSVQFATALLGRHGILNILAGVAVAGLYGIAPAQLTAAVAGLKPGKMRGERFTDNGILILNDCYNANPDAVQAMIDVLRDSPARRRIAVLGEMLELGKRSECLHREVGRYAARSGIDVVVAIHGDARFIADGVIESGKAADNVYFLDDAAAAGDLARQMAREGDAVLFKGSRGTRVERALERFLIKSS
jgi:UDP-N-acetylmuramoyl-tripeptide--D-alanyl-D-alanine ligase